VNFEFIFLVWWLGCILYFPFAIKFCSICFLKKLEKLVCYYQKSIEAIQMTFITFAEEKSILWQ
jgi:hypothetical protein